MTMSLHHESLGSSLRNIRRWYFGRVMKSQMQMGEKYASFKEKLTVLPTTIGQKMGSSRAQRVLKEEEYSR